MSTPGEAPSFEEPGISAQVRAYRLCDAISEGMRQMGVITTAHYDAGIPLIVRMIETLEAQRA